MTLELTATIPSGVSPREALLRRLTQQALDANAAAEREDSDEADRVVLFVADQFNRAVRA